MSRSKAADGRSDSFFRLHPSSFNQELCWCELYVRRFGDQTLHARSVTRIAALPLDAPAGRKKRFFFRPIRPQASHGEVNGMGPALNGFDNEHSVQGLNHATSIRSDGSVRGTDHFGDSAGRRFGERAQGFRQGRRQGGRQGCHSESIGGRSETTGTKVRAAAKLRAAQVDFTGDPSGVNYRFESIRDGVRLNDRIERRFVRQQERQHFRKRLWRHYWLRKHAFREYHGGKHPLREFQLAKSRLRQFRIWELRFGV
jgi:hypothetical protein